MEGQGPHVGTPVEMNLFLAGTDTVAVDAVSSYVMGFETIEIAAIRIAATDGLGERDIEKIEIAGTPIADVRKFFKRPMIDPTGLVPGVHVVVQHTCPGCFANVRGAFDLLTVSSDVDLAKGEDSESSIRRDGQAQSGQRRL